MSRSTPNLEVWPMAGRPVLNALASQIEDAGGDEVIFSRIRAGDFLTEIAKDWDVSRQLMYDWIRMTPERQKEYKAAKRDGADGLVESAYEDLENASTISSQHLRRDQAKSDFKKWLASKRNRDEYGDTPAQTNVNLNLGLVHLQALREGGRVETVEYEEIPVDAQASALDSTGPGVLGPSPDRERAEQRSEQDG